MPTDPPKPGTKPKPGAKGAGLKRKVGPLPLWAWIAIVGGAAAGYWFLVRGRSADGGGDYGGPEVVTGSGASGSYSPQQAASAGAPGENAALAGQLDPAVLDALSAQIGDVRGHVTELEDALSSSGFSLNEDKTWSGPGAVPGYSPVGYEPGDLEGVIRSVVESMGGVQAAPARPATKPAKGHKPPPRGKPGKPPKTKAPRKPPKAHKPPPRPPRRKPPKPAPKRKVPARPAHPAQSARQSRALTGTRGRR